MNYFRSKYFAAVESLILATLIISLYCNFSNQLFAAEPMMLNRHIIAQDLANKLPSNVKVFWTPDGLYDQYIDETAKRTRKLLKKNLRNMYSKSKDLPKFAREIEIHGLRRSGNHIVSFWLLELLKTPVAYFNNLRLDMRPFESAFWTLEKHQLQTIDEAYSDRSIENLVLSYEDYSISDFRKKITSKLMNRRKNVHYKKKIIVLRDPFNLLLSRNEKFYLNTMHRYKRATEIWIEHAKLCSGYMEVERNEFYCIYYNKFIDSIDYRQQVAEDLNLDFIDYKSEVVPGFGQGSSFTGENQVSSNPIRSRISMLAENQLLCKDLMNETVVKFGRRLFPKETQEAIEVCSKFRR